MKVFISWSGDRSRQLATAFHSLLPDVLQSVEVFLSAADIEAGVRWGARLNEELNATDFGIICLTPENLGAEWLLYEAGALGKTLENSRVCPCVFQVAKTDVKGPLAQFQACDCDEAGIRSILGSANKALGSSGLSLERFNRAFDRCYPEFGRAMEAIPKSLPETQHHASHRKDRELLEEMLLLLRDDRSRGDIKTRSDAIRSLQSCMERYNRGVSIAQAQDDVETLTESMREASRELMEFFYGFQGMLTSKRRYDIRNIAAELDHLSSDDENENFSQEAEQLTESFNNILTSMVIQMKQRMDG